MCVYPFPKRPLSIKFDILDIKFDTSGQNVYISLYTCPYVTLYHTMHGWIRKTECASPSTMYMSFSCAPVPPPGRSPLALPYVLGGHHSTRAVGHAPATSALSHTELSMRAI